MSDELQHNGNAAAPDPEVFPLDDAAIEILAQTEQQVRDLNNGAQAVLAYFLRQHKLTGNWRLAPNRRELILEKAAPVPNL